MLNTIQFTTTRPDAVPPRRSNESDAGADLSACIPDSEIIIHPNETVLIPTGIAMAIPFGYVGLVHPRSGLSVKTGLRIPNSPGTIDASYRGEIMVPLYNTGTEKCVVWHLDRIAQLLIQKVELVEFRFSQTLTTTERGSDGFGSTGR